MTKPRRHAPRGAARPAAPAALAALARSPAVLAALAVAGALAAAGCGPSAPPPPAVTPVLVSVARPGTPPTGVMVNAAGAFDVLPSGAVLVAFRAPLAQGIEVTVDGVVVEQTSSVARQQTLEGMNLGHWSQDAGSPNVSAAGDPLWSVFVTPAPALRTGQGFTIGITGTTGNATTPRSATLAVPIALGPPDWVSIPFNPMNDDAVVLLDGQRSSGCTDDEMVRGKRIIDVGDMRARGNCNEEMVVFTHGNAVQLITGGNASLWSASLRDFVVADASAGLLTVPVDVWLLRPGLATKAASDFARANVVYDDSRCGLLFVPTVRDVSTNPLAATLFSTDVSTMENQTWRNSVTSSALFTAGRVNVYYTGLLFLQGVGFTAQPNFNIIGIGGDAGNETLSHELGHSFSLQHSNGVQGITSTNIMNAGGVGTRTALTEGQCFRVNLNRFSTLNTNLTRTGWLRDCPDGTANFLCPLLNCDVP